MGYFPNGSSGLDYQDRFCSRCIHCPGCPIWDLHLMWNYEACRDETKRATLDHFIPQEDCENQQCRMFRMFVEIKS